MPDQPKVFNGVVLFFVLTYTLPVYALIVLGVFHTRMRDSIRALTHGPDILQHEGGVCLFVGFLALVLAAQLSKVAPPALPKSYR